MRVLVLSGGYVLWSNGLGSVRCASVKGEESQDVFGGGELVKRVVISEKFRY